MAPQSPSSPGPPAAHEYSSIIHSIQRRATDRASSDHSPSSWRLKGGADASSLLHDLEEDLRLSAKVGSALLEEKGAVEKRLLAAEAGNQKLLDRLTSSVKEAAHLQRVSVVQSAEQTHC